MERIGIAGLANSGKSSLLNAVTNAGAAVGAASFSSRDANVGVATVPDPRLDVLADMEHSKKIVGAQVEFVDVAGLVAGSSRGEGLGNAFLARLREVDAIVCVLRAFEDPSVAHPDGSVDPVRDMTTLETEFLLSDLEATERAIERLKKASKSGDEEVRKALSQAERIREVLEGGTPVARAAGVQFPPDLFLLTDKPLIYAVNIGEDQIDSSEVIEERVRSAAAGEGSRPPEVLAMCAKVEAEAAELDPEERAEFLAAYSLGEGAAARLVRACYASLGIITFLTTGEDETRAWTCAAGSKAPQAAGKIHSDMERGFIRMEVVSYDDLVESGSMQAARERGLLRVEGKEYVVQEGDVVHVRFNV